MEGSKLKLRFLPVDAQVLVDRKPVHLSADGELEIPVEGRRQIHLKVSSDESYLEIDREFDLESLEKSPNAPES